MGERLDTGFDNTVFLKFMSPIVNTDGGIGLDDCVKAERPKTLTLERWLLPLDWEHDIRRSRSLLLSFLVMAMKAVISGAPDGYWYGSHAMDRLGYLR